jgi:hypothetical protein
MKPAKLAPVTDTTILTLEQVATWLQVKPRQVSRMGVPTLHLGAKTVRFLKTDVAQWLESQRVSRTTPRVV